MMESFSPAMFNFSCMGTGLGKRLDLTTVVFLPGSIMKYKRTAMEL